MLTGSLLAYTSSYNTYSYSYSSCSVLLDLANNSAGLELEVSDFEPFSFQSFLFDFCQVFPFF